MLNILSRKAEPKKEHLLSIGYEFTRTCKFSIGAPRFVHDLDFALRSLQAHREYGVLRGLG